MISWLALAAWARPPAAPPHPCPVAPPPRETAATTSRTVPATLLHASLGPPDHGGPDGTRWPTRSGGAIAPALADVEAELRARDLWIEALRAFGPRSDGVYLVLWWAEEAQRHPVIDVVWVRPTETLVGLLDRPRDSTPVPAPTGRSTSLQVFLLPPDDYPPVGLLFDALP